MVIAIRNAIHDKSFMLPKAVEYIATSMNNKYDMDVPVHSTDVVFVAAILFHMFHDEELPNAGEGKLFVVSQFAKLRETNG